MKDIQLYVSILECIIKDKPKTQKQIWEHLGLSNNIQHQINTMKQNRLIVKNKHYEVTKLGLNVLNKSKELITLSETYKKMPNSNDNNKHE